MSRGSEGMFPTVRPTRSVLSVPGSNWSMIKKAVASSADTVLIDLEDAVAPDLKVESRKMVVRAFRELDWGIKTRGYRINGLGTPFFYRDLVDVVEHVGDILDFIVVPKVNDARDVHAIDSILGSIEANVGFEPGKIKIEPQIETAGGLTRVEAIASASPRLQSLIFGPGDYAASTHMPVESIGAIGWWDEQYPGHRFHYAMSRVLVAARAANLSCIDGPVADFRDSVLLHRSCTIARALGYDGKWCIHPDQIAAVNDVFSPTERELAAAQAIIDAYREAVAAGSGATSLAGTMVDEASIRVAENTLQLGRQAGSLPPSKSEGPSNHD